MKVRFGEFTLDAAAMLLQRDGREVHLSRKAFELLRMLVENRSRVVGKAELQAQLWPDTFVVETNLNVLVAEVRRALADPARSPRLVKTVHGVGYRFCGEVEEAGGGGSPGVRHWLILNDRRYAVRNGETTIGRDPGCDVWLDVPGVSRRHARIRIDSNGHAVLEDTQSTNGTYVAGTLITAPTRLRDGDDVRVASQSMTFRSAGHLKETERVRPRR